MSTMNTNTMINNTNDIYCSPLTKEAFQPKQQLRCLFCRGKRCKNCGEYAYLNQDNPAIPGIISFLI